MNNDIKVITVMVVFITSKYVSHRLIYFNFDLKSEIIKRCYTLIFFPNQPQCNGYYPKETRFIAKRIIKTISW